MGEYNVISKNDDKVRAAMQAEWPDEIGGGIMCDIVAWSGEGGKIVDGDAFVIRDVLIERGCKWGEDFYIQKADG